MDIKTFQLSTGAAQAEGVAVIIDVFRAFSFECYAFSGGAERIYPVADVTRAHAMKAQNPGFLLAGERGGVKLPGFDVGNSPFEIQGKDLRGKSIVHTTSAGTQGIDAAVHADVILLAAFVNARATADYIRELAPQKLSLVCMGFENREPADEDTLCAEYIRSILQGGGFDKYAAYQKLKTGSGARFMDARNAAFSPPEDFELCMVYDRFDFAIRVDTDEQGRKVSRPVRAREGR